MIVKNIDKPEINFRLLIEKQIIGDKEYKISDSYAPEVGNVGKRVSVATIDESKINEYKTECGLDFRDGEIKSYYIYEDRNGSSHGSDFLQDPMGYYKEIMDAFEILINSGNSEFTSKALEVFEEFKNALVTIGSGNNAI